MLLVLLATLSAQPQAARPVASSDVVVTGEKLQKIHDECRKDGCTPLRDAQASIAWAEAQFREGRYVDAKRTLREAAARNKRHAATDPKPVAAVYEAYATVAWQEGDQFSFRRATAARVRTLRDNLPPDDVHVRAAALALGDMWLRLANPLEAQRAYEAAERSALDSGHAVTALRARLARVRLRDQFGDERGAAELLADAASLPGASEPGARVALAVTQARIRRDKFGRDEGVDLTPLLGLLRQAEFRRPILLYAPPYPPTEADQARRLARAQPTLLADGLVAAEFLTAANMEVRSIVWGDIGFWVRPDGTVAEAELLRGSRDRGWAKPYLRQVEGRRYAPVPANGPDDQGSYRVERFTLRSNYLTPTGSLISRRGGFRDLEVIDLTEPSATVTASR